MSSEYSKWRVEVELLGGLSHYDDCIHKNWSKPIDECPCNCYSKRVFEAGRQVGYTSVSSEKHKEDMQFINNDIQGLAT